MQKYDVHFCLVSDQAAPNLLPILDSKFKPKEVVLIVTQRMKEKGQFLAETFKKVGVKSTITVLQDEFNFGLMEDEFFKLAEKYEEQNIALNVTGATKLISIAAEHAFSALGKPIFYVDTDNNRMVFISKDDKNNWVPDQTMNAKTSLDIYLSSYGGRTLKQSDVKSREKLVKAVSGWIKQYDKYKVAIPMLNLLASQSVQSGFKTSFTDAKCKKIALLDELLKELNALDLIDYCNDRIDFRNTKTKDFFNGGWLEDYTYLQIQDIKQIDDLACGIEVANSKYQIGKNEYSKENKGNMNEFDIAFMANNKFHIIEVKTQIMGKNGGIKSEDILYKLETLKDYGGYMTKKCLVTYFDVPESVQNRAKFLNIELIQAKDLLQLKSKIQNWIGKK